MLNWHHSLYLILLVIDLIVAVLVSAVVCLFLSFVLCLDGAVNYCYRVHCLTTVDRGSVGERPGILITKPQDRELNPRIFTDLMRVLSCRRVRKS